MRNFNVENITLPQMSSVSGTPFGEGVVLEDGKTIYMKSFRGQGTEKIYWVDQEELQEILNNREHYLTPSTFYKIQPEIQGKVIFLTGPPGAGKSTSASLLAKGNGFVYYEADGFLSLVNPYVPLDCDPGLGVHQQLALKGFPERTVKLASDFVLQMLSKSIVDLNETSKGFYKVLVDHIKREKARIGGDWIVSFAVPQIAQRSSSFKSLTREGSLYTI